MKFTCLLFIGLALLPYQECFPSSWIPVNPMIGIVNKNTAQVTNFVKETGRTLNNYYDGVRSEISLYFGDSDDENEISNTDSIFYTAITTKEMQMPSTDNILDNTMSEERVNLVDPDLYMTTLEILARNGYPGESHTIVTDDGYILTVHRIPFSKHSTTKEAPRKTVLLQHGVLGSSPDWVIPCPKKGLGYILSDAGYDVWMSNVRGNTYSRAHISKDVDSFAFWNFTFHEMSQYDLPAVIDYITDVKGGVKINYIGFSMGTTALFALLSTKPEYNHVLNAGFALAPIAYMSDVKSPVRYLAKYNGKIDYLMKLLGANEFLPQNAIVKWLSKKVYKHESSSHKGLVTKNILFVLCGHDEKQFNQSLVPAILNHVPAGTSTKTLIHYSQVIKNDGKFQQFDYGTNGNFKQYGQASPPEYPVEKITLPIALIGADNDWLSSPADVKKLYDRLPNVIEYYKVPYKDFNHMDFLWGIDAPTLAYEKLLQLLESVKEINN